MVNLNIYTNKFRTYMREGKMNVRYVEDLLEDELNVQRLGPKLMTSFLKCIVNLRSVLTTLCSCTKSCITEHQ